MRASRPSVRSVTVLPPVFGPVTTSAREVVAEADVDRHDPAGQARVARAEQLDLVRSDVSARTPSMLAREARLGGPEVERGERVERLAQRPALRGDERRQLVEDALSPPPRPSWASRQALPSSTTTSGSMNSVWPLPDWSWTMPLTLLRASARTGTT